MSRIGKVFQTPVFNLAATCLTVYSMYSEVILMLGKDTVIWNEKKIICERVRARWKKYIEENRIKRRKGEPASLIITIP